MGQFLLNHTSVDDARRSIKACTNIHLLRKSLDDERNCRERKEMIRMIEVRLRKLEEIYEHGE